ncbi:pyruvate,water dikinase [Pedobacter cryoconitis]|uniref:Prodigiosin synthesizing transferase PigC n=1 Tax=Pedobacter cryoconitis TaxID=188932 RepID=A0A7W9DZB0_9SPHI|nr:phosphoenolpyruvate synthase [Pedobacter cryoconitis]MBB5637117.1 pyruvate,water dikinase [Pedobacter cryoconitis]
MTAQTAFSTIEKKTGNYVISFQETDSTKSAITGGKGTNLGELSRIKEISVPEGFCITTQAYKKVTGNNQELNRLLEQLMHLEAEDRENINKISAKIRSTIESTPIAKDIIEEIEDYLARFDEKEAFAVRSSATAEDLPKASFAGQQDTYLNIIGKEEILKHISKCWASLFTARAIIYRIQNGFGHQNVYLSVIIQKMVFPQAAGILFTADPVTSNRKVVSIDASFGLGEAMVSGLVNTDLYQVCNGSIIQKKISTKKLAVSAIEGGGTQETEVEPAYQNRQALTDDQILQLERTGRAIEQHFGRPQDIEWCLSNDTIYIVQSRPITTLYPIPEANDQENHVYVSVGHQQMMTDAMKPLGLSFFLLTTPAPMRKAGGRLFVDITSFLTTAAGRKRIIDVLGKSDPLIKDALLTILGREDFIKCTADEQQIPAAGKNSKEILSADFQTPIENGHAIVSELIQQNQLSTEALKQNIRTKSGTDLFDFILEDIQYLTKFLSAPGSIEVIMAAMNAAAWINEKMNEWLGERNAADTLSQSVPNNITSEMGLALLDVADVIRPFKAIIDYLKYTKEDNFLDELLRFDGGQQTQNAIAAYLNKYGMRCSGEIDISKNRWSEKPLTIVPMILGNIKNLKPGASRRKFELGRQDALEKEQELLHRLMQLPDGKQKAEQTKRAISLIRDLTGYREYPKYGMVNRYFIYKQALLKEIAPLIQAGIIHEKEDMYYLTFEELRQVISTNQIDYQLISERKEEYKSNEKLNPPRVITSDGEIISGAYKKENLPAQAIAGLAVSSGIIEGRARVILNMEDVDLEDGDILVTSFTDPSWTPLFVSIKGLVTEVGGLMTHGAVIAREYGLPAVVGVEHATRLIKDGQQIRVNGTDGYVLLLDEIEM